MNRVLLHSHLQIPTLHPASVMLKLRATKRNPVYDEAVERGYPTKGIAEILREYHEDGEYLYFPRYYSNYIDPLIEVIDYTSLGEKPDDCFHQVSPILLRGYQKQPVEEVIDYLFKHKGVTLNALMGTGKTVAALEIARRMRFKTLVLVHTEFLMKQWQERSEAFLGITPGIVQGDVCDTSQDITIAMMQTLNARDYSHLRDMFGFIIVDECHRASAPVFSSVIQKFTATYRLGISGTVKRVDGLEWIFFSHIGPPAITMERSEEFQIDPKVFMYRTPGIGKESGFFMRGRNFIIAKFLTELGESPRRNTFIAEKIIEAARHGRRIIVFSDRKNHLKNLAQIVKDSLGEVSYGYLVGGMKEEDRQESQKKQIIFCTFQLASEGLDIPELDVAFLTTPKKNVQQAVGRLERVMEGKKQPIIMDFVDMGFPVANALATTRRSYYESRNWEVVNILKI